MPNVRNFLDLSTGHLRLSTREGLDDSDIGHWIVAGGKTMYGYFLHCPEDYPDALAPDLKECFEYACALNCDYILFDCDAPQAPALPFYEDGEDAVSLVEAA